MNKRWYDADPIITNAINLIQNSKDEKKNLMADFIIKEAKNLGVEPDIEVGQSTFGTKDKMKMLNILWHLNT